MERPPQMHTDSGKPCKSGHLWSAEDDAVLRLLHRLQRTSADLSVILHRTDYAVRLRLRHLGEVASPDDVKAFCGAAPARRGTQEEAAVTATATPEEAARAAHDETLTVMGAALWSSVRQRVQLQERCDALDDEAALYEGRVGGLETELEEAKAALAASRLETQREVEKTKAAEAAAAAGAASAVKAAAAAAGAEAEGLRRKLEDARIRLRLLRSDAEATRRRRREAFERHRVREAIVTELDVERLCPEEAQGPAEPAPTPAPTAAPPAAPFSCGVSAPSAPLAPTAAQATPPPFSIGKGLRPGVPDPEPDSEAPDTATRVARPFATKLRQQSRAAVKPVRGGCRFRNMG